MPRIDRYQRMEYNRCGESSLVLPPVSLGMWQNFGTKDDPQRSREMILHAFDRGVTHFDLANNYGPLPGSAEVTMGRALRDDLGAYRDELIISTKAGHDMWEGPYGGNSSRKNILASCDQSLRRMGLEYVDIFYTHRYDGVTPLRETAQALISLVRSGKALYVGISKYPAAEAKRLLAMLAEADVPALVAQYRYSMLDRSIEAEILPIVAKQGAGVVAFSPLAQGLLSSKYIGGVPSDSRIAKGSESISERALTREVLDKVEKLNLIAKRRGNTLAQVALKWALRDSRMTSLVMGASSMQQLDENIDAIDIAPLTSEELAQIDKITL